MSLQTSRLVSVQTLSKSHQVLLPFVQFRFALSFTIVSDILVLLFNVSSIKSLSSEILKFPVGIYGYTFSSLFFLSCPFSRFALIFVRNTTPVIILFRFGACPSLIKRLDTSPDFLTPYSHTHFFHCPRHYLL